MHLALQDLAEIYNDAGFPAAHFRVLDSSNVAGLLLSYCESLAQELSSNIRSLAI
jgi:hypothetical protein